MNCARTEERASPNTDLWRGKGKNLLRWICGGGALPFSGQDQVDAAAKLDKDEVRCGDIGGALVTDGGERKKMRTGRTKEVLVGSIYKEGRLKSAKNKEAEKHELSNYNNASIFEMVIKTKIRWDTLDKMRFYDR